MHHLKAMVIDDDPSVLFCFRRILQYRGYEVETYENPTHTPMYLCTACPCSLGGMCPDLIISDFTMPVVNGIELLESAIRKGCRCLHLAVISATPLKDEDLAWLAHHGGRHFRKPVGLDVLNEWLDCIEREVAAGHHAA